MRLWRPLLLALWGVVLLQSAVSGRLALLLRAEFHTLVVISGLSLLALALLQLPQLPLSRPPLPRRPLPRGRRDRLTGATLAGSALAVLAVPPRPSFQILAARRPPDQGRAEALTFVLPPEQRSLTDWVRLLRSQPDPRQHAGEPVRLSGFLLPVPGDHPQLSRLLVRCCLADATPVGLPLRWRGPRPADGDDHWFAVEGQLVLDRHRGEQRLLVEPRTIRPIPRPARPLEP